MEHAYSHQHPLVECYSRNVSFGDYYSIIRPLTYTNELYPVTCGMRPRHLQYHKKLGKTVQEDTQCNPMINSSPGNLQEFSIFLPRTIIITPFRWLDKLTNRTRDSSG